MTAKKEFSPGIQLNGQQQLAMSQRLIMSAHMQQAIKLLQIPIMELETFIDEQVVLNPLLEIEEDANADESVEELAPEPEPEQGDETEHEVEISDTDLAILSRLDEDMRDLYAGNDAMPIKRTSDEDEKKAYLESSICAEPSLHEQLMQMAHDTFSEQEELDIAEILVGYIDQFGFLKTPIEEICLLHNLPLAQVKHVLLEIQTFEPFGVGASSIQESLLLQLRGYKKEGTLAYQIIRDHYDDMLHNHIPAMQKKLHCSYEEIQEAITHDIAKLDLHPGTQFSSSMKQTIIPDVTLRLEADQLIVDVDRDRVPSLKLNSQYLQMLDDPEITLETKQFIKRNIFSARWLFRNIQQRYSTIERIAQILATKQKDFFLEADGQLQPLTMKMVADELNLHESTVARTVSHKYLDSPRGIFPLRSFFTSKYVSDEGQDMSARTVKDVILEMVEKEDREHPLSDEKISSLLKEQGIPCARRTVAKYRLKLQIGNTQQRRKFSTNK
jgi:RNA polymerase sigma-54 factor